MNDEDEIHVLEGDPEKGENGNDYGFRFSDSRFADEVDPVNGIELRDFGEQDDGKLHEEAQVTDEGLPIQQYTTGKRIFLRRHIQMMAISVSIGTGVFYYTGSPYYEEAGPVSLLLAFILMGTVTYSVLITIGEMVSMLNLAGGIISFPYRFWLPGMAFAVSWLYAFGYAGDIANKAASFRIFMYYWFGSNVSGYVWISIFYVLPISLNLLNVRRIGEIEFTFTAIKVCTLVGLVIAGFVIIAGGTSYDGPPLTGLNANYTPVPCSQNLNDTMGPCLPDRGGFIYWRQSAFKEPFDIQGTKAKVAGFWDCCAIALFSYTGTELVAITAWETEYPRHTLPRAVRRVSFRIVLYYVGAVFILGLTVSPNDPLLKLPLSPSSTPSDPNPAIYPGGFIVMAERAGIPILPHIINVVMIIATISVGTADIYVTSRCLSAMSYLGFTGSENGLFTRLLQRRNRFGVPWVAVWLSAIPGLLALMTVSDDPNAKLQYVYQFFIKITALPIIMAWAIMCITYLYFKKAVDENGLETVKASQSLLQPWLAYWAIFWSLMMIMFQGFKIVLGWQQSFQHKVQWALEMSTYASVLIFLLLFVSSRWVLGGIAFQRRQLDAADIANGMAPTDEPPPEIGGKWRRAISAILDFI